MHAVVVNVTVNDIDQARRELEEQVVPRVSQAPGIVAGYWIAPGDDGRGLSVIVFDSEQNAQDAAARARSAPPSGVTFDSVDIREVVAHV